MPPTPGLNSLAVSLLLAFSIAGHGAYIFAQPCPAIHKAIREDKAVEEI